MKSRTLFCALAAAQSGKPPAAHRQPIVVTDDDTVLAALRNSATDRDQILRRRLGIADES